MIGGIDERVIQQPKLQSQAQPHSKAKLRTNLWQHRKFFVALFGTAVLVAGLSVFGWRIIGQRPPDTNPFTNDIVASVKFPLYYPTQLPNDYRVDPKSLNEPSPGVVVFDLIGPRTQKLYISEEMRPASFDLGGFYKKFSHLQEIGVSDGAIAVGYLRGGQEEVASRANNQTWILANVDTNANIPLSKLMTMLKSVKPSY